MWTCNDIRQRSAAYFANELPPAESSRVEHHLATCAKCRLELSEAYSGFRVASAAFNAPDPVAGLNAARLGTIYAAAVNGPNMPVEAAGRKELRRSWFAAAAAVVVLAAAWMGQPIHEAPAPVPVQIAVAEPEKASSPEPGAVVAAVPHSDYPPSYGLIYPQDYRAAGGYTPDDKHATVLIDYDSIYDHSVFIYDPAYGMGRTVISDSARMSAVSVPSDYGLDGPKTQVRL